MRARRFATVASLAVSAAATLFMNAGTVLADVTRGRVWVAPFTEVKGDNPTPAPASDWMARALRQSVSDDIAAIKGISVLNATTEPSGNVDYVVNGTIQRVEGDLRVTGRIEDTKGSTTVGGF